MGRAAVMELLVSGLPMDADRVWPNFALDGPPSGPGVWVVLRWGAEQVRFGARGGKRDLNIWAYSRRADSTDYEVLDQVLFKVEYLLTHTVHYTGNDGSKFITADFQGFSEDLLDNGYDAIAKNARFVVLCADPAAG
jgi:hypothetical protein